MNCWKTSFLLGWLPARCYVSFREGDMLLFFNLHLYCHVLNTQSALYLARRLRHIDLDKKLSVPTIYTVAMIVVALLVE